MRYLTAAVLLAALATGCGSSKEPGSKVAADPTPMESTSCSDAIAPAMDAFDVLYDDAANGGLTTETLGPRYDVIEAASDPVKTYCSHDLALAYLKAVVKLAEVQAGLTTCKSKAACDLLEAKLTRAFAYRDGVQVYLDATR